jgi:hypothetical protein
MTRNQASVLASAPQPSEAVNRRPRAVLGAGPPGASGGTSTPVRVTADQEHGRRCRWLAPERNTGVRFRRSRLKGWSHAAADDRLTA